MHRRGAEGEGGDDAARIGDAAGGDDRDLHCIDDLRQQGEETGLVREVIGEEDAAMAAGLVALRDDRVGAVILEPAGLI